MAVFHVTMFSNALHRLTEMTAIVPVEKSEGIPEELRAPDDAPLKTVMLLHGFSGTHSDWLFGSRIQQLAMRYHIAVLCPSGENAFYVDDTKRDALYEQYLCEVLAFSRRVFPLSQKAEDTVIGGLSMGGYGAMRNGLKHPELFGGIIALSSAFITDELAKHPKHEGNGMASAGYYEQIFGDPASILGSDRDVKHLALQASKSGRPAQRIFMACGTEDFLKDANDDFSAYLTSLGMEHTYVKNPGVHDWAFWDAHIEKALEQFFANPA